MKSAAEVPNTERKQTTEIWHVRGGMLAAFGMLASEAALAPTLKNTIQNDEMMNSCGMDHFPANFWV